MCDSEKWQENLRKALAQGDLPSLKAAQSGSYYSQFVGKGKLPRRRLLSDDPLLRFVVLRDLFVLLN